MTHGIYELDRLLPGQCGRSQGLHDYSQRAPGVPKAPRTSLSASAAYSAFVVDPGLFAATLVCGLGSSLEFSCLARLGMARGAVMADMGHGTNTRKLWDLSV